MPGESQFASALNAARNRKQGQDISQGLRKNLLGSRRSNGDNNQDREQSESAHKTRLAFLKASAHTGAKALDKQLGAKAGLTAGTWLGSFFFGIGAVIGGWLGWYVGGKYGATKIIAAAIILVLGSILLMTLMFILLLKGYCDTWTGWATDKVTLGMCQSIGSLQNVK